MQKLLTTAKATHIFSANMLAYMLFNDQSFNDSLLTKDIVSFEQLGPLNLIYSQKHVTCNNFKYWDKQACANNVYPDQV